MTQPTSQASPHAHRLQLAQQVLAASAWTMLVLIILGIVISIPPLERVVEGLQGTRWVDAAGNALLLTMGFAAFGLWGAAVLHALLRPNGGRPRTGTVIALVATNVLGGLVYYFFFVRRRPHSRSRPYTVEGDLG